jgi:NADPH:quinone reductase-like Zn-dependent oxidoreductase
VNTDRNAHPTTPTTPSTPTTSSKGSAATMRAVVQDRYGADPDAVLAVAEVGRPAIGDHDVLVRVAAAGVDMGTWHCMSGMPYAMRLTGFGVRAPKALNPGRALAGTVEAVGRSVTSVAVGDEVYGATAGSFAQYASVPADRLARKPWNLTSVQAAAVPISGATALQAVRKAGVQPGQRVLVVGASGGVGSFAVQIAKAMGATVTGVCSTPKVGFVEVLGADRVVDYRTEDIADGAHEYDVILDIGGSRRLRDLRRALAPKGTLVIVGGETDGRWLGGFDRSLRAVALSPFVGQTLGLLTSTEKAAALDDLRTMVEAGLVTPAIDRTFPLAEAAAAIRHVRDGRARGKVVVTI